ncbi:hypothetical protein LWI28_009746 [Acer negundo]|uniref:Uncharacterized protein n=1 Tax=Acer negundo TaxID=4023 RepID=A0AAD5NJ26_ACENE|nr:hypothetical protein LWI28_009746 [Acer negundo]
MARKRAFKQKHAEDCSVEKEENLDGPENFDLLYGAWLKASSPIKKSFPGNKSRNYNGGSDASGVEKVNMVNPVQLSTVNPMRNTVRDKGKSVAEDIPIKATAEKCKEVESSKFEFQSQGSRISDNHGIRKGVVAVSRNLGFPLNLKLSDSSLSPKTGKWKMWVREGSRLNIELGLEAQLGKRSLVSPNSDDVKRAKIIFCAEDSSEFSESLSMSRPSPAQWSQ